MESRIPTPRRSARKRFTSVALCAVLLAILLAGLGVTLRTPDSREAVLAAEASATQSPASAVEWERPRFDEREDERQRMVLHQIIARGVDDPVVVAAMEHVPRHRFVPEHYLRDGYRDS
ncbi:unnamed protein product, partial [marine sediment metagenome]